MLIQGILERPVTNQMHFEWGSVWILTSKNIGTRYSYVHLQAYQNVALQTISYIQTWGNEKLFELLMDITVDCSSSPVSFMNN